MKNKNQDKNTTEKHFITANTIIIITSIDELNDIIIKTEDITSNTYNF